MFNMVELQVFTGVCQFLTCRDFVRFTTTSRLVPAMMTRWWKNIYDHQHLTSEFTIVKSASSLLWTALILSYNLLSL